MKHGVLKHSLRGCTKLLVTLTKVKGATKFRPYRHSRSPDSARCKPIFKDFAKNSRKWLQPARPVAHNAGRAVGCSAAVPGIPFDVLSKRVSVGAGPLRYNPPGMN